MASSIRKMKEEARCYECLALMTNPVTIECGHNFCQVCIEDVIKHEELPSSPGTYECPRCWEVLQKRRLQPNKLLKILIETIKEMERDMVCEEHREQLQLFCMDDGQLICWCCVRSSRHRGHSTTPIEHVCPGYKEKLQKIVTELKKNQDICESAKLFGRRRITHWEEFTEDQRKKIQSEFQNLHNFLHEEEKHYLWKLENEKEKVLRSLQDDVASLEKQGLEFENHICEVKKKCYGSPQNLMQDVEDMQKRFSDVKPELPDILFLEPKTGCNLPKLCSDVKKVFESYQDT